MTASESLYIETDLDPKALLMRLIPVSESDIEQDLIKKAQPYRITGIAFANAHWDVYETFKDVPQRTYAKSAFGFRETLILFITPTPDNEQNRKGTQELFLQEILKLIKTTTYNLGVNFYHGIDVLQRVNGKLTLFSRSDWLIWTPERLNLIDVPYEMISWTIG